MKRVIVIIAGVVALLSFSASNKKPLTERQAIEVVTKHPLFQVYEKYLQQKYDQQRVYRVSAEAFGYGYDPFGDYYILTFQNTLGEPFRHMEADIFVVQVNVFSGSALVLSFFYKDELYAVDTSVLFKDTY